MSPPDPSPEPRSRVRTVTGILDPAFGFFVWAAHLLAIYIIQALACAVDFGGARLPALLTVLTVASALVLVAHAILRWRQFRGIPEKRFRMGMTIGSDAIASVAILLQLFPVFMMPVCA